ncbi:hypothetical protein DT075_39490 [Bacillus licheniformis]|nr:hypothetical protein DT075_39490 [Bacillus licheniformis]
MRRPFMMKATRPAPFIWISPKKSTKALAQKLKEQKKLPPQKKLLGNEKRLSFVFLRRLSFLLSCFLERARWP